MCFVPHLGLSQNKVNPNLSGASPERRTGRPRDLALQVPPLAGVPFCPAPGELRGRCGQPSLGGQAGRVSPLDERSCDGKAA